MSDRWFIQLVADYGMGDPAFGEVSQRLRAHHNNVDIFTTSVPAFDTLSSGFWIYQYALGLKPEKFLIYANTAPRKDQKQARADNEGEGLVYAQLENGSHIMAVNAGFCYSFVKPYLRMFRSVHVANKGSQFRSRDFYPKAVAAYINGEDVLGDELDTTTIPDVPTERIAWIDGYGNIKTTIRRSQLALEAGAKVKIAINNVVRTALVAGGNFSVAEGELSFSPGSSGYEDPFFELFLRGGSAYHFFGKPKAGAKIRIVA